MVVVVVVVVFVVVLLLLPRDCTATTRLTKFLRRPRLPRPLAKETHLLLEDESPELSELLGSPGVVYKILTNAATETVSRTRLVEVAISGPPRIEGEESP